MNNLLYSGSFLFDIREDAFAFTLKHLESNVAPLFSIMGNNWARVLMACCLSSKLVKENIWRTAGLLGQQKKELQQTVPVMRHAASMGPLPSGAAWCRGAKGRGNFKAYQGKIL